MENNDNKRDEAWSSLRKSLAHINDFAQRMEAIEAEDTNDLAYESNPFTKDDTKRTHARTSTEIIDWADKNYKEFGFRSRELMIGSTMAFALAYPKAYNKFLTQARESTTDTSIDGISKSTNSDEESSSDDTQTTKKTPEMDSNDNSEAQKNNRTVDTDRNPNPDNVDMDEIEQDLND